MGVRFDLILVLRSQFFDFLRETLYKHALESLEAAGAEKKKGFCFSPTMNAYLMVSIIDHFECDWSGYIFGARASTWSLTRKMAISPSSTVHGGQHDTKYVTFEWL